MKKGVSPTRSQIYFLEEQYSLLEAKNRYLEVKVMELECKNNDMRYRIDNMSFFLQEVQKNFPGMSNFNFY